MNRRYTVEQYRTIIKKIRTLIPDCSITTDIIVGFCGETDQQFENTISLYEEIGWDMTYLARYSSRTGTVATRAFKDDVTNEIKAKRWHRLNKVLEKHSHKYHKLLEGRTLEVLVERFHEESGESEGRSRENKIVQFPGSKDLIGKIVPVKITNGLQWLLKGELVQ